MVATGLGEDANDGYVFFLVVGSWAQTYVVGVEQFMRGGIEVPSGRSEILGPTADIVSITNVIGWGMMHMSIAWVIDQTWGVVEVKNTKKI